MSIVTFWSNSEKTIGQTVTASCAATVMAMEKNYKILLIAADVNNDSIEGCFGAQQSNRKLLKGIIKTPQVSLETGVNGLIKMAKSGKITPETIKDYTKIIYKNRLEVLYSSTNNEFSIEEQMECFKNIVLNSSKYYDYVFVDLKKGLKYQSCLDILDMSDVIVLNTDQGTKTINDFCSSYETNSFLNKSIWNICKYDKKSKYNIKNLNRTTWKMKPIYITPYNTLLFESSIEGLIPDFLLRIRTIKNDEQFIKLYEEIKKLVDGILLKQHDIQMKA